MSKNNTELIWKHVLKNALDYNGQASLGSVLGKVIGEQPELKKDIPSLKKEIEKLIAEAKKLSLEKIKLELETAAPEMLEEKSKEEPHLPPLTGAVMGKVVTRLAPEPSKYNHLGHALVFLIQYQYAQLYKGKCILRWDDTNPEKESQEYCLAMKEDLKWLGLRWDEEYHASNHMLEYYKLAERLIQEKRAYTCKCPSEQVRKNREKMSSCACKKKNKEENLSQWKMMLARECAEGEMTLRLVGDMKSNNGVMRDPIIFRICYAKHFLQGEKYAVWPMYDFESAVEDGLKVTHVIRSKEFELRAELQTYIRKLLNLKEPVVREIGRYQIAGTTTQGREIREGIETGKYSGWDDPRLVTLKALRRRGILPEAIQEMSLVVGMGKSSGQISPDVLESINRKIIDKDADRYFFIDAPQKIKIGKAPKQEVSLELYPNQPERGERKFTTGTDFVITDDDFHQLEEGRMHRLMDCLNFRKKKDKFIFDSQDHQHFKIAGDKGKILHWLPAEGNVKIDLLMLDGQHLFGVGEAGLNKLREGTIVQFERVGFVRLDKKEKDKLSFWFTHK